MREYPEYSQYSEHFLAINHFSCRELKPIPNIWDRTPANNTGYTLQLQASSQVTMLRSVLDHNPNAITTV